MERCSGDSVAEMGAAALCAGKDGEGAYSEEEFEPEAASSAEEEEPATGVGEREEAQRAALSALSLCSGKSRDRAPPSVVARSMPASSATCRRGPSAATATRGGRANMSFSNDRLRSIERENHILLRKILSAERRGRPSAPPPRAPARSSAAVLRARHQARIERENLMLLKKIQNAKSTASVGFRR